MKKWLTRCAVPAVLVLIALLAVVRQPNAPGIQMGRPLPPGKVTPQLANAGDAALLLAPDGSLWAWGGTFDGITNLFPHLAISPVPRRIGLDSDWTQLAGNASHAVALKNDGSLWAWGRNESGQVGQGNFTNGYGTPTRVGAETNWTQICAGGDQSLALRSDGSLWAWGMNKNGQLGDSTTNNRSVPTMIGTDRDWQTITADYFNSFALKSNGAIWAWGYGRSSNDLAPKQIGPDTNWQSISAHSYTLLALKMDGTLWWRSGPNAPQVATTFVSGSTATFTKIGRDSDWAEIYAGWNSLFARKKDGSWWVCGQNFQGQLGLGTNITAVPLPQRLPFSFEPWAFAPGSGTTLMVGKDGKLWTWGVRLGVDRPSAARQKFRGLRFPGSEALPGPSLPDQIGY